MKNKVRTIKSLSGSKKDGIEILETYTLLVWEEIPERGKLAIIPNDVLTEADFVVFRQADGHMMNSVGIGPEVEAAIYKLTNALYTVEHHLSSDHPMGSRWAMRFKDYIIESGNGVKVCIEDKIITRVYRTGWYL